ncbi:hypothetical protein AS181_18945 [Gordonia sp. SGD-V-85]|nr:hypothetical protein AS181_18945 [Gordonia sp. SGD-V-85]
MTRAPTLLVAVGDLDPTAPVRHLEVDVRQAIVTAPAARAHAVFGPGQPLVRTHWPKLLVPSPAPRRRTLLAEDDLDWRADVAVGRDAAITVLS